MASEFHLLDLVSQATAVQRLLHGKPTAEKLAWLSARGTLSKLEKRVWPDSYLFESSTGARCVFFLKGDTFCFVGDNTVFTVQEKTGDEAKSTARKG